MINHNKRVHAAVIVITAFMIPGFLSSLTPIDIEAYNMDSPELEANDVMREEFSGAGNIWGFGIFVRDPVHIDEDPSRISMIEPFPGESRGLKDPIGGVLNLSILREVDSKAEILKSHDVSMYYLNFSSDISGIPLRGVLDLPNEFRVFMDNRSLVTRDRINPFTLQWELAPTNWTDCGVLECLSFDDPELTQAHIDLAAHRMANHTRGSFLRYLSVDRAFLPDPTSPVIGPYGGTLQEDGTIIADQWGPGRWTATSVWMILNLDRQAMVDNGWTFAWIDARPEFGFERDGLSFSTDPIEYTMEQCQQESQRGLAPCSVEWLYLAIEEELRATDEQVVTVLLGEGPNVEINRELLSSSFLVGIMGVVVVFLLWMSLRRVSDVLIVGAGLSLALLWMQGSIGWIWIIGDRTGYQIIARSQFSNLLPILVLALGIDDSLHALHRYKEERRNGADLLLSAHMSISKVGRAIMLTSLTTIVAFLANLSSNIAALRSFGVEAGLGVFSAFVLTGLWVPLLRLDYDRYLDRKGKLMEEKKDLVHLVPSKWLSDTTSYSFEKAPLVAGITLILTVMAISPMAALEGDFQIDDFLDPESDFARGVNLASERFADGEPGYILVEGDIANPRVLEAIEELRRNINSHGEGDPDQISRTPTGQVELLGLDQIVLGTKAAMAWNITPYQEKGWDPALEDGGVGCNTSFVYNPFEGKSVRLPELDDRECLIFIYGYVLNYGVPASGGYPEIPAPLVTEFIQTEDELDPNAHWRTKEGGAPNYVRMSMRFGLSDPEQFPLIEPALEQLVLDMEPLANLSSTPLHVRASISDALNDELHPISWAIPTGDPVVRFVAADGMQDQMQGTLALGLIACMATLWWGYRPDGGIRERAKVRPKIKDLVYSVIASGAFTMISSWIIGWNYIPVIFPLSLIASLLWGRTAFLLSCITTIPIAVVIVWLYALIQLTGYGLNMITVSIAAISLGVGIDYVIHVIERFREEMEQSSNPSASIKAVGGASGLALVGSALSDIAGFLVIMQSSMGFFSTFGLFCAVMIGLALVASMVLAPAALRTMSMTSSQAVTHESSNFSL
tara:strand:+ start:61844 stop:65071 length:3228 start_codon:yes stop_codon:yes gene_type:complete